MPSAAGDRLYISNEVDGANGGVTVAEIDATTGEPSRIDHESTGSGFVFTALDPAGNYVLAASYNGDNVSVFPVGENGELEAAIDTQDVGDKAHSVRVDASGKWAYVPTLGDNAVAQLAFDAETGELGPNPTEAALDLDGGPRHIALHPDGVHAYVMCELEPTLVAFDIAESGVLEEIDRERTVPENTSESAGAHVLVHPSGNFVYVSNRNQQSIGVFEVAGDGTLDFIENEDTRGVHPRNFDIDPTGKFLIVANKGGDGAEDGNLSIYDIAADGTLSPRGDVLGGLKEPTAVAIVSW
jgi:6-phosphogluconolactonase